MNHYTAQVTRSGRYWHIHVPELDRVTQARNVAEIEPMARDLVAVMLDVDPESFTLDVQITMPATVRQHLDRAKELREQELRVRSEAAAEVRAAALEL
jgi:hypothetical protein